MSGPLGDHSLDLPFEAGPPGQYVNGADLLADGHVAGGVVDDDEQLAKLVTLTEASSAAAISAAQAARNV